MIKRTDELTPQELLTILQARTAVFVVEQEVLIKKSMKLIGRRCMCGSKKMADCRPMREF